MADHHPDHVPTSAQQKQATNASMLPNHENTTEQSRIMTEQHLDQLSISSEEAQTPDNPMMTHYEAPWSPSAESNSQQHRLCKIMSDAFGEGNTEKAQIYARVLLLQGTLLFRVYAHLILAYGIDHGLTHARTAVQEAEQAVNTLKDNDGQVAKLLALAKRTLTIIEEQDATMKDDHQLSDIEEEDEEEEEREEIGGVEEVKEVGGTQEGKEIKKVNEVKEIEKVKEIQQTNETEEAPAELNPEMKGVSQGILRSTPAAIDKSAIANWNFKALKDGKRSNP